MAMEGCVSASPREPRLTVDILNHRGAAFPTEVVIDTGFTGSMTLPSDISSNLQLQRTQSRRVSLAHGNPVTVRTDAATTIWHGTIRRVRALELASKPLIGMSLLWDSDVAMAVRENGPVVIDAPPRP